ncbi:uncharacterized protein LOC118435318 [Folsomia candida]|uniref:uncharacterized protein LOC118435318 n=1 Tax=Folsomia candida TaxID=158441 RepID=UPI001604F386|nr:uncharacterized protein LOC118435318 [Folsomia candida]
MDQDSLKSPSDPVASSHSSPHTHDSHSKEEEEFDEGRITISKVMLGSKSLKKGTTLVILASIVVVVICAGLGAAGASLSPIIFPILLLPIAIVAFLLFIPSIILFVPIVIAGLAGGQEKRRRRMDDSTQIFANHELWACLSRADNIISKIFRTDLDAIIAKL